MIRSEALRGVRTLFAELPCPWYVCGGWAIDLFVGRETRPHKDVDVAVARTDQAAAYEHLRRRGWRLDVAHRGSLTPWDGAWLAPPLHGVWCRNDEFRPSFVELLLNEIDAGTFRFRRDPAIRMPIERAVWRTSDGLPALAPEIVLLYKASDPAANEADFAVAAGALPAASRAWLHWAIEKQFDVHPWVSRLAG